MGLDRKFVTCLNEVMNRLPSSQLGPADLIRFFKTAGWGFASLLGRGRSNKRISPLAAERMRFEKEVHEQFIKLKEKGLSIPVFTL